MLLAYPPCGYGITIIQIILAFLIGYITDKTGPQAYHYDDEIVIVYKNYQCPSYCGVNHNHYVYFEDSEIMIDNHHLMCINKDKLGDRFREKRNEKPKSIPMGALDKPHTGCP